MTQAQAYRITLQNERLPGKMERRQSPFHLRFGAQPQAAASEGFMKTIVFDFGNVLGYFDHGLTLNRLAAHTDMSRQEMVERVYQSHLDDVYESGQISSAEFLRQVRQLCRLRCDDQFLAEAWSDVFQPNHDVCALVPRLKSRYRLLLGSNTNELHAGQFRRQFADTLQHFHALVLSHEVGTRKPHAGFFQHCQGLANCQPRQCLFIDDLPANIAAAQAHGWKAILYRNFDDLKTQLDGLAISI